MQHTAAKGPRPRSRRGHGDQLREEILAAVNRLLDEWGSDEKLTMRAVAQEVGVAAPSIYLHFTDKAELVWAALADKYTQLAAAMQTAEQAVGTDAGPRDRLRAQLHAYCRFALANPGRYRLMYQVRQPVGDPEQLGHHPARQVSGPLRRGCASAPTPVTRWRCRCTSAPTRCGPACMAWCRFNSRWRPRAPHQLPSTGFSSWRTACCTPWSALRSPTERRSPPRRGSTASSPRPCSTRAFPERHPSRGRGAPEHRTTRSLVQGPGRSRGKSGPSMIPTGGATQTRLRGRWATAP